jgi:undecaprenyl diphosphate synthase
MELTKKPTHIAIICDGNRRYAKKHKNPVTWGYQEGAKNVDVLSELASKYGIKKITFWLLSTENRQERPKEVEVLFKLGYKMLDKFTKKFKAEKVRFNMIGRRDRFPKQLIEKAEQLENETKEFDKLTVTLALDYGGHDELIRTIKKVQAQGLDLTSENIEANLDTADIGVPDLIIRTSGAVRLSGFMAWQSAYSELYFPEKLFPEFKEEDFVKALQYFSSTQRNFGK